MNEQYALDEATIANLIAEPEPFNDYLDCATDYTAFCGQLRDAIDYMLQSYGLTHDHAGRAVSDNEAWRQSSREELAKRIAVHLCAGLAPQMEQHNYRAFLGALDLIKRQRAEKGGV